MTTQLATRPEPETTRLPGDFHRHPYTGAPMVTDPTKRNKIKGKKADLLKLCKEHGIEPPAKATNPELIALLEDAGVGGKAPMVQYGRPSSFGKQIENSTNLQKWAERMVAYGAALAAEGEVPA